MLSLVEKDSKVMSSSGSCKGLDMKSSLGKCQIVGPPISYDYPTHPFFLMATRKVVHDL